MDDTDKLRNSYRLAGVHVELQVIPAALVGPL
jgi:hypothetical protein